ncbi:MAG: hypothetical protein HYR84_09565 [Planctomycetes bacterium]|nr:hypothetical protein [Planctomycetota bacterium]
MRMFSALVPIPIVGRGIVIVWIGLLCLSFSGCEGGETEKFEKIDIGKIYATFGPPEMRVDSEDSKWFEELRKRTSGASNVYLVRGRDIGAAIDATHDVENNGRRGDEVNLSEPPDGQAWMVVFFGRSSSSLPWTIHAVEKSEKTIRLKYRKAGPQKGQVHTTDVWRYYAWVPLGDLKRGKYQLEIWDQDAGERTLARACVVLASISTERH